MKSRNGFLAVVVGLLMAAGTVQANTIEVLFDSHSGQDFTYKINLSAAGALKTGNYFAIYDFAGFQAVTSNTSGFTFLGTTPTGNGGMMPVVATPPGFTDTALPNLVFKWEGGNYNPSDVADTVLGYVTIKSLWTGLTATGGAATSADAGGYQQTGQFFSQYLPVASAPLPASAWSGMGLLGLIGIARARKALR